MENEYKLEILNKETHRIVDELTNEFIYENRFSIKNDSIIDMWADIDEELRISGEYIDEVKPRYYNYFDLGLFNFTAGVIRRVLSSKNLNQWISEYENKKNFELPFEGIKINDEYISPSLFWLDELGFKINHSIIDKYMNIRLEMIGSNELADDETMGVFKPSTIEYEQKCGFNDGSAVVDCGKAEKTYSIYGYVGFIMSYLFDNPLIKHWGSIFREEDELRTIIQSEINSESDV